MSDQNKNSFSHAYACKRNTITESNVIFKLKTLNKKQHNAITATSLKKKRGSVMDFFSPFDSKPFASFGHGMGSMGGHPLSSPMSSYYGASMSGMGLGRPLCHSWFESRHLFKHRTYTVRGRVTGPIMLILYFTFELFYPCFYFRLPTNGTLFILGAKIYYKKKNCGYL